ncbi:uncharacterized protein CDAR_394801 [Caerostris darwini]|uniref:Reverse transcriptase domain-containing protein n=1 Tax=Caerostris darwini TaxID=1538125 RepID=A0AAV4VA53_9ARAC|nr:uncharacterized protein CDAR_394801 [Caerostris darwini]
MPCEPLISNLMTSSSRKRRDANSRCIVEGSLLFDESLGSFYFVDEEVYPIPLNRDDFISLEQLESESALLKLKPHKAPDIDLIPNEVIKEMYLANKTWFTSFFNTLLSNANFPKAWKIAIITLIPKPNKDYSSTLHYRLICLLPTWGKLLDKIISNRISYYLESKRYFSDKRYGFRKNRSTITALQSIKNYVDQAYSEENMVCLVSLDFKNTFNSVN